MIVKELLSKSEPQLEQLIQDLKAELFMLRFKNTTGQLEQVHKVAQVRKDIARVYTAIQLKETNKKTVAPKKAPVKKTVAPKKAPVKKETTVKEGE